MDSIKYKDGYYWVKEYEHSEWKIMMYREGFFVGCDSHYENGIIELFEIGERIEQKT